MKLLETEFTEKGFAFSQVVRRGNLAVYRRAKGNSEHFEVVRIRSSKGHAGYTVKDKDGKETIIQPQGPHELYPSSEKWGTDGFTHNDEDSARAKMGELEAKSTESEAV